MIAAVTEHPASPAATEIVVALNIGAPDLSGTIRSAAGPDQPFTGWLGLMSALETAVAAVPRTAAQSGPG